LDHPAVARGISILKPLTKYLIFDRDQKFGFEVIAALKATRINSHANVIPESMAE